MYNKQLVRVSLDDGAYMPVREHEEDAGLDLRTPEEFTISDGETLKINTGVHVQVPRGYMGLVLSKSGLYSKDHITAEGLIDTGYTGPIYVTMTKHGEGYNAKVFNPGDKIAQFVIVPYLDFGMELVKEIDGGDRGANGFGSTGA